MKEKGLFLIMCPFLMAASNIYADIQLPAIIGDNMVLQQNTEAPIWGWASSGETIAVEASWLSTPVTARTDPQGAWMVKLKTPKAGGPYAINIKGQKNIELKNVMIGEVWICAGQSNMEMGIGAAANGRDEIKAAKYPNIRLFRVQPKISAEPLKQLDGKWSVCSPESIASANSWGGFSAVGFYFGREIQKNLNVPVGLIQAAWGGTVAEAWTSKQTLLSDPVFEPVAQEMPKNYSPEEIKQSAQALQQWFKVLNTPIPEESSWMNSELEDSSWKLMQLPQHWQRAGLTHNGVVWFRKAVTIPAAWAGKDLILELGPIDDEEQTWVNGKQVGKTNGWNINRSYKVPSSLVRTGKNVIAVRVVDNGGLGGIYGQPNQMKMYPAGEAVQNEITLAGDWLYKVSINPGPQPEAKGQNPNKPTVLYNGMIAPLVPYGIRGVIWYQGESNAARAFQYRQLFAGLIKDWRTNFKQGDFAFYFAQIAPLNGWYKPSEYAELCEAQFMALRVPNTGMAITSDIGNLEDIHPQNKQDVGRRLALWALAKTYGQNLIFSGPLYKSMQIEGDKVRIFFDYTDGGLMVKGPKLTHFTVAGSDRQFVDADAVIDGNSVVVSSQKVKQPVAVRYAWGLGQVVDLFNKAGLPASLFRTDDWPAETMNNKKPTY